MLWCTCKLSALSSPKEVSKNLSSILGKTKTEEATVDLKEATLGSAFTCGHDAILAFGCGAASACPSDGGMVQGKESTTGCPSSGAEPGSALPSAAYAKSWLNLRQLIYHVG